MATRETRLDRAHIRAGQLRNVTTAEFRSKRLLTGLSQASLAKSLSWAQSRVSDLERGRVDPTITDLCEVATVLGLEVSIGLHPSGEPLRDSGQLKLIKRFEALLSPVWHVMIEAPFPTLGDARSWDALIRLGSAYRVGIEAETRVRDQQELVRRIRQRELHGGVDHILLVLSDSAHNRRLVAELRAALGSAYLTSPQALRAALRASQPLPGSGVILL